MTGAIPDILAQIVASKREQRAAASVPLDALEKRAAEIARRNFSSALTADPPAIIAEIKRASPSCGPLAPHLDSVALAKAYARGGAAALSVLTEERHFAGSLADLEAARAAVELPVLRKDFTLDEYHVVEAAAHGADAVLLIAAILPVGRLRTLREEAERFGMAALVEVHDEEELKAALDSGARIIGINNRNLRTFEVRLETSLRLAERIPAHVVKVSESGIHSPQDIARLREAGFQAFLVGEHLVRAADPAEAVRSLRWS